MSDARNEVIRLLVRAAGPTTPVEEARAAAASAAKLIERHGLADLVLLLPLVTPPS